MKRLSFWFAVVCVAFGLFLYAGTDPSNPTALSLLVGRLHASLVHFPIALLLVAGIMDLAASRSEVSRAVAPVLYALGAATALLAALAGLFLSLEGGYDSRLLYWHKRLGIATAVAAWVAWRMKAGTLLAGWVEVRALYRSLVAVMLVLLLAAGHLGGSLTHGPDYLTRHLPEPVARWLEPPTESAQWPQVGDLNQADLYADLVQPIFEARCVTCHDSVQRKGQLELDSEEGIRQGGQQGPALVEGRSAQSELMRRILLPLGHPDHMPPQDKPQLSVLQAETIRWWIDAGAPFQLTAARSEVPPLIQRIFDDLDLPQRRTGIFALDVASPDDEQLETLRGIGISVMRLAENEPFLHVRCPEVRSCLGDSQDGPLSKVAEQIAWLDLRNSGVDDAALAALSDFEHLTHLYLQQNSITDASLKHLGRLQYLEYLNLFGTGVSDEGLEELKTLSGLKSLYLWHTQVTPEGAGRLAESLPGAEIDLGHTLEEAPADTSPSAVDR